MVERLDLLLERLCDREEIPDLSNELTGEEQECETHFQRTHARDENGRYVIRLPFKSSMKGAQLGDSLTPCKAMLKSLEKRFERDSKLESSYSDFMYEYEKLGHMKRVNDNFFVNKPNYYFLPHHGVIKEDSTTTKLRIVFNASYITLSGYSLNDLLHAGANLLPDLASIILRWRKYRFAFIADIEKMYRQIRVHIDDQHFQMIVWRWFFYALGTLTYGMNCSPFIANRVRLQLAHDERSSFPLGAEILEEECYMDDVTSGADTVELALKNKKN